MKKGFTLIELLAVILILGIIALVAFPAVNNVINDSKKDALKQTTTNIIDAAEQKCLKDKLYNNEHITDYVIKNNEVNNNLKIKNLPQSGTITVNDACKANAKIMDNNYCAQGSKNNITVTSNINSCGYEENGTQTQTQDNSCFIFNETTGTIEGYNFDNPSCTMDVKIPDTINDIPVLHIGDFAFVNKTEDDIVLYCSNDEICDNIPSNFEVASLKNGFSITSDYYFVVPSQGLHKSCYNPNLDGENKWEEVSLDYVLTMDSDYLICKVDKVSNLVPSGLHKLTSVDFRDASNLQSIGGASFYGNNITNIYFDESNSSLTSIGGSSFISNNLTSLDLSKTGITNISGYAFTFNQISSVIYPNTNITLGPAIFMINLLENLDLPNNVTEIPELMFASNNISGTLEIPSTITKIGEYSLEGNNISAVVLHSNLELGPASFGYNNITSINIPSNVTIGAQAFLSSNSSLSVTSADNVTFDAGAFYNSHVTSLTSGKNNTFGEDSFYNNPLTSVTFDTGSTFGQYAFAHDSQSSTTIATVTIPSDIRVIPKGLFSRTKISTLNLSNTEQVSNEAFRDSAITSIDWGTSLKTIGTNAFVSCRLPNIILPNTLTALNSNSFYRCTTTGEIVLPNSLAVVGKQSFYDVKPSKVTIPSNITSIGDYTFRCTVAASCGYIININKPQDSISGSPWGNNYATINWLG